jgi:hypothetical protein
MRTEKKANPQHVSRFILPHSAKLIIRQSLTSLFQIEIDQTNQTLESHKAVLSTHANLHESFFISNNNELSLDTRKVRQAYHFIQNLLVSLKERNVCLFVHAVVRLGIRACKKLLQDTKVMFFNFLFLL